MPNSLLKHLCFRNWQRDVTLLLCLRAREKQQCLLLQERGFQMTRFDARHNCHEMPIVASEAQASFTKTVKVASTRMSLFAMK